MRVMCIIRTWRYPDGTPTTGPAYGDVCTVTDAGFLNVPYYELGEWPNDKFVQKAFVEIPEDTIILDAKIKDKVPEYA